MFNNKRGDTTELVLLAIVAIVAIVGLLLLFARGGVTGKVTGDPNLQVQCCTGAGGNNICSAPVTIEPSQMGSFVQACVSGATLGQPGIPQVYQVTPT